MQTPAGTCSGISVTITIPVKQEKLRLNFKIGLIAKSHIAFKREVKDKWQLYSQMQ